MSNCLQRHREARQRRGDPVQHAQRVHLRRLDCIASLAMTVLSAGVFALSASAALADDISCVSTTFRLVGRNDQVCVSAFDDPKVPGVACHISQARTGGVGGSLGLAEDPSRFSIPAGKSGRSRRISGRSPITRRFTPSTPRFSSSTPTCSGSWTRSAIPSFISRSATR